MAQTIVARCVKVTISSFDSVIHRSGSSSIGHLQVLLRTRPICILPTFILTFHRPNPTTGIFWPEGFNVRVGTDIVSMLSKQFDTQELEVDVNRRQLERKVFPF